MCRRTEWLKFAFIYRTKKFALAPKLSALEKKSAKNRNVFFWQLHHIIYSVFRLTSGMDVSAVILLILCTLLLLPEQASSLRFFLKTNSKRCFKEEIHKGIVVKGEYELSEAPGQRASIHVCFCVGWVE